MEPDAGKTPETSAYSLNAFPTGTADTPACVTVTPPWRNEKTANPWGDSVPGPGLISTEPTTKVLDVPAVCSIREVRAGIEYAKREADAPLMVTDDELPALFRNSTAPVNTVSPGLTRTICVVQPAPSAK